MANALGNYNEIWFAQEALIQLESALGMAGRVYREYDPTPAARGDTIRIRKPGTFTAQDAPSVAQDIATDTTSIVLDQWKEVKFELTDKELSLTSDRIISDHIRPAAYALANKIDQTLVQLFMSVPWYTQMSSTFALGDIAKVRQVMFDNGVPLEPGRVHLMVDGLHEQYMLSLLGGQNIQGAGVDAARQSGNIGTLFGLEIFANQNTPSFTAGNMADAAGTVVGAHAKGVEAVAVTALSFSQAAGVKAGDTLVFAGNRQRYVATANATTDGSGATTINIYPKLAAALAGGEVVTLHTMAAAKTVNLGFHRNFAALAMAPLSTIGNELGARIATVSDPKTNLTLRSRMYYEGGNSKVGIALDVLYGTKILDGNLAVRGYSY
jgi:P22 coat protein - gene protein 5